MTRTEVSAMLLGAALALAAVTALRHLGIGTETAIEAVLLALLVVGTVRWATSLIRRYRESQ